MSRRNLFAISVLAGMIPMVAFGQPESAFYTTPKTVPEFWRAARFEIRIGNFERASDRIKGLLDLNPDNKTLVDLVEGKGPDNPGGMGQFLALRNVPRWHEDNKSDRDSKARVEEFIDRLTKAMEAELNNVDRIRRFAVALSGPVEEAAFALKELRRSGKAVAPVFAMVLHARPTEAIRNGIISNIRRLPVDIVPGLIAYLPDAPASLKPDLIDAIIRRDDVRELTASADRDPVPTLWFIWGNEDNSPSLREKARNAIFSLTGINLDREPNPELRSAQGQLAAIAQRFHENRANLNPLPNEKTDAVHTIWQWDGKTLSEKKLTRFGAAEYYGLRYARWALQLQPDNQKAQIAFLGLAIENHVIRAGAEQPLSKTAPDLHGALASAPYELLADLFDDALRAGKTSVLTGVVRVFGERQEIKAVRPSPRPGATGRNLTERDLRPALLVKALDYPDPRVQFLAADAILKTPGAPVHGRNDQIVKILAAALAADKIPAGRQKALLADPDAIRSDGLASFLRRVGYDVDTVATGRDLLRRLQAKADIDLLVIDRHVVDPMLNDLVAQVRGDTRGRGLPVFVVASPDGITPIQLWSAMARLASTTAVEDLPGSPFVNLAAEKPEDLDGLFINPETAERAISDRHLAQIKRMTELFKESNITFNEEMEYRINYLSIQTFSRPALEKYARKLLDEEKLMLRRLLPSSMIDQVATSPVRALRPYIRPDIAPSLAQKEKIAKLMRLTARAEENLASQTPPTRLGGIVPRTELMTNIWDAMWSPTEPRLPPNESLRSPEVEIQVGRAIRGFQNIRIVPAVFGEAAFRDEIAQATDPKSPMLSATEKAEFAKTSAQWLRKMATGEVPGYRVKEAEQQVRSGLADEDLASICLDIAATIPTKEVQQDVANVVLSGSRPLPLRKQAADVLAKHLQSNSKLISDLQLKALVESAGTEADPDLVGKLQALTGILSPDRKSTGERLKNFVPKEIPKEAAPPKDEPKADPKDPAK